MNQSDVNIFFEDLQKIVDMPTENMTTSELKVHVAKLKLIRDIVKEYLRALFNKNDIHKK